MAMKTIKGPAIFLAQFAGDNPPFNTLENMARWAAGLGYKGVQIPSWDGRLFDLKKAASSKSYCDDVKAKAGVEAFIDSLGLRPLDVGGLNMAHWLEGTGLVVMGLARHGVGNWDFALGVTELSG